MRLLTLITCLLALAPAQDAGREHFERAVRPLLLAKCASCHGSEEQRGGVRLDSVPAIRESEVLDPDEPSESLLMLAVRGDLAGLRMPPDQPLTDAEIKALEKWIAMGAPMPDTAVEEAPGLQGLDLWALKPMKAVEPPAGEGAAIDRFLAQGLSERGLTPAAEASLMARTRRQALVLTGLPPTVAELDLVESKGEEGLATLRERWLDSPHYAERWARHWMDLVRYSETRGHEYDFHIPQAWVYRDYLIEAFQTDLPFDALVREHIAGDLLSEPRLDTGGANRSAVATGWWCFEEEGHAPVDPRADHLERAANRVEVLGKTFLGLTVACARCHDHKFDAISAADYHAFLGIVTSTGRRLLRFETDAHNRAIANELEAGSAQSEKRRALSLFLAQEADGLARDLAQAIAPAGASEASGPWAREVQAAQKDEHHGLRALLGRGLEVERSDEGARARSLVDPLDSQLAAIVPNGPAFGAGPRSLGHLRLEGEGVDVRVDVAARPQLAEDPLWRRLKVAQGAMTEAGALAVLRAGRTVKSPRVRLAHGVVWHLVRGSGHVFACVEGHRMLSAPLHVHTMLHAKGDKGWRFVRHDLRAYREHQVHFEYSATGEGERAFAVGGTWEGDQAPALQHWAADAWFPGTAGSIAQRIRRTLDRFAAEDFGSDAQDARVAAAVRWLVDRKSHRKGLITPAQQARRAKLVAKIRWTSQLARAAWDGEGQDEPRLARGRPDQPKERVQRRYLETLDGPQGWAIEHGSGRLQLAQRMTRGDDPFVARVWVNRVWRHVFGQGLVATVDNLGVMGERPSHPELLDWLALKFVREGWSTRKLIAELVQTAAFARSSAPNEAADTVDPRAESLHRYPHRRVDAEVLRDSLLALSGRLDQTVGGPSVPLHLTAFMQGRGRPRKSGPLDGAGRRSLYLAVRKNFLVPFLTVFDFPAPSTTVGRRTTSNVPAQGLTLLNDPFVRKMASLWSERLVGMPLASERARVIQAWREAFARRPSETEIDRALAFLEVGGVVQLERWPELTHALILTPEFTHPK